MNRAESDLSSFDNSWYNPGNVGKRIFWYLTNVFVCKNPLNPSSKIKIFFLKLYGAKIGENVTIKPSVNIKYPWNLEIGDNTWIGEKVWIDNLDKVKIGSNVCISQGALLLCGNHNYKKTSFDLIIKPIEINDGTWVGAKSVVCQGVICKSHSLLTVGSIATTSLEEYSIYQGNPAVKIRDRVVT